MTAPETNGGRMSAWRTLPRLLAYVGRHRRLIVWSVVTMILAAGVDLLLPEVVKRTVDGPIRGGDAEGLWPYGIAFVVVLALGMVIRAAREVVSVAAGRMIGMSLRMEVFEHIQRMSLRFFDKNPVGVLATRVTSDVEAVEEFFSSGVAAFFHDILKLALILVVLFAVNAELALVVMSVVPLLVIVTWLFMRRSRRDFARVREETASTNGFTTEAISGIRVTRLFGREPRANDRYGSRTHALMDAHLATVKNFSFFFPTVNVLSSLSVALVIQFGASQIVGGGFTYGEFFQFWLLIDLFFQPIRTLSDNLNMMLRANVSAERLFQVLDTRPEIEDGAQAKDASGAKGQVAFDDVHFAYNENEPVLRGVSFAAEAGTTLALVGPTGAGKTSVLNLISRFYDVPQGSVKVDGRDVRAYDVRSLRARIAVVLQDVFLFRGSVLENIRLFDPGIRRADVEQAVRAVHADRVVDRLPEGLDSMVEERGANLSVGERQLIAFARALVHDPAVLVLDEATSSIDTATERLIQDALETMRKGRTTIVVAHRLSTIKSADQILVLRRGRVEEAGTHKELLEKGGLYRRLYELQARSEHAAG
ncbi:MAG: ABC transporter ATP-binding protein [Planctomycetota bacterium]|nr:ABC transporter ATP-binding protein [Planctomycetota bacterium]